MGLNVFTFGNVNESKKFIDNQLKLPPEKQASQKFNSDIIVITSGSLKEEVIAHVKEYNSKAMFGNKFKKIIVFCRNLPFHQDALQNHPELVFAVIN